MKKKLVVTVVALFVLALSFAMVPKQASAIPAFAQKYHFSCAVCHTQFPNLNPFGRAFWRNGFRLPGTNGTPADATQITEGLSLSNPWPVPIMMEGIIMYNHVTNENISAATDAFGLDGAVVAAGTFKLYSPFANSISYYMHWDIAPAMNTAQIMAGFNGLGSGFGIAPHLFNLKIGQVTTASPYFYRQAPFYLPAGPVQNVQGLTVGNDQEAGALLHARNAGFDLYGTPGYHLWYKVTVTNDAGGNTNNLIDNTVSNAMEYSYQIREFLPVSAGQLEFSYYGATIAESMPNSAGTAAGYTNRISVNGFDVDLANNVYEVGATYMVQSDSKPYGNPSLTATPFLNAAGGTIGNTHDSNGYSTLELYARYLMPGALFGQDVMLSGDYATYSWTHQNLQQAFNAGGTIPAVNASNNLYQSGSYASNEGVKNALDAEVWVNLALNAHLYVGYLFTNKAEDNMFGTGLDFAF